MTRKSLLIAIIAFIALAVAAAIGYFGFGIGAGSNGQAHPPCGELPSAAEVQEAIEQHDELTQQLKQAGSSVSVNVGRPCGATDQALIDVHYGSKVDKTKLERILNDADGFGVPVTLSTD